MEKGTEGTVHLQFYISLKESQRKRITAMKKVCPHTHWATVGQDNGASDYAMKEDTRLEGPWEFGEKPLKMTNSSDNKKRRQLANADYLEGDLK
jgi:hypothetical protein